MSFLIRERVLYANASEIRKIAERLTQKVFAFSQIRGSRPVVRIYDVRPQVYQKIALRSDRVSVSASEILKLSLPYARTLRPRAIGRFFFFLFPARPK